jgi:hypothetical protein
METMSIIPEERVKALRKKTLQQLYHQIILMMLLIRRRDQSLCQIARNVLLKDVRDTNVVGMGDTA